MPIASTNISYYPSTISFWTGSAIWYIAAIVALVIIGIIFISTRRGTFSLRLLAACVVAAAVFSFVAFMRANPPQYWHAPVFSPEDMLITLWTNYKEDYINSTTGETFDDQTRDQTTSEAEGYTLLRAIWMDDKPQFDASWQWTQKNLRRNDDLFSWLYGKRPDGTFGILTAQNGENSASDADTDIALALVFAYSRWQNPAYLTAAEPIIHSIWTNEVFTAQGVPYLGPDNLVSVRASTGYELINPSYLSPYAYRIFSYLDPHDDWNALIDSSYQMIDKGIESPLGASTSGGLPPDWMEMNTATGALSAPPNMQSGQTTDFGYDALRVPFRITLDWLWYGEPRASTTLSMMKLLGDQWSQYGYLDAVYHHDGSPGAYYQSPAMYGGAIGYFMVTDPAAATALYKQKLTSLYNPDTETWKLPLDYYDANIAWFGMALYNHDLPDLFDLNLPTSTVNQSSP